MHVISLGPLIRRSRKWLMQLTCTMFGNMEGAFVRRQCKHSKHGKWPSRQPSASRIQRRSEGRALPVRTGLNLNKKKKHTPAMSSVQARPVFYFGVLRRKFYLRVPPEWPLAISRRRGRFANRAQQAAGRGRLRPVARFHRPSTCWSSYHSPGVGHDLGRSADWL